MQPERPSLIRAPSGVPTVCVDCGCEEGELVRLITVAGTTQLRYQCLSCGGMQPQSVKQAGWDLESIRIAEDRQVVFDPLWDGI